MADYNINAITRRVVYTGSAGLGPYAFSFEIIDQADVGVYFNQTALTLSSDYTVTINANGTGSVNIITGGNVPSTPTANDTIIIIGARDIERTTDFVTAGDLLASSLNEQLDSNIIFEQQIDERVDRSIKFPVFDSFTGDNVLPAAAARADKILKFDNAGNVAVESASALFSGAVVGANFTNNTFTGDGSQTAFTTTVEAGSKNNAQVYIDGVYQLKSSFSVSGLTLTFTEAPPLNSQIEVIIGNAIGSFSSDANAVNYNQGGTGAQTRTVESKLQDVVSVKDFGAVDDGQYTTSVSITSGSNVLTSSTSVFAASDVGKRIIVWGAGSGTNSLVATISGYTSGTSITLNTNASTTASNVEAHWGTDNHSAFINAVSYLNSLGGGTLTAQGSYFICNGVDGDVDQSQHNVAFQYCSNITFNFNGATILGTLSFNTNNGSATVKTRNVTITGGTYRAVGDRIEAPNSSTVWNVMTFIYAEDIRILGVNIYVPAGARGLTLQSNNLVGTDAIKLKNIVVDGFLINGPSNSALRYLSDGIDLLTGGGDSIWDGITITDGIVSNVGRGLATQNSGTFKNNQLHLENIQFLDTAATGLHVADVYGLRVSNVSVVGFNPDPSSNYVYLGRGFTSYNCVTLGGIDQLSIFGIDSANLDSAVAISQTGGGTANYVLSNIYIDKDGSSNEWSNGLVVNADEYVISDIVISKCNQAIVSSATHTGSITNLVLKDNTTAFNAQITIDRRANKIRLNNYREFDAGQSPTATAFDGISASGRLRYSTVPIGSVAYSSMGTDSVQVAGSLYIADLEIPRSMTITGIGVLNGSTVGTDSVIYGIYSYEGLLLGSTSLSGTTTSGANAFQEINLTSPITVNGPARFGIVAQINGTTDKLRKIAPSTYIDVMTQIESGSFGTITNISWNDTFTANVGPIAYVY